MGSAVLRAAGFRCLTMKSWRVRKICTQGLSAFRSVGHSSTIVFYLSKAFAEGIFNLFMIFVPMQEWWDDAVGVRGFSQTQSTSPT